MIKKYLPYIALAILIIAILLLVFHLGSIYGQVKMQQILNETMLQTIKIECLP